MTLKPDYRKEDPRYDQPPREQPPGAPASDGVRIVANYEQAPIVTKPWGREILLSNEKGYTYKRIEIKAGFETSLQYHLHKSETIVFLSGQSRVVYLNKQGELVYTDLLPGSIFETRAPALHRVVALTDISYLEASTPDPNGIDVFRVRDGQGRGDGRIESEYKK